MMFVKKKKMFVTPLPLCMVPMKHKTNSEVLHQGIVGIDGG